MSGTVMLEVQGLVKRYGDFLAVDHLSFQVFDSEIFGLLGPNGAGKTTTIRTIMDIFAADGGRVTVLGRAPGLSRAQIGYLPEERGLYRDLRVEEVLVYLAELKGTPRRVAQARAEQWLERVGLGAWQRNKVKDLSRGMQQKLQFVACLIHDPQLLILDEPFQGLDPVNVELISQLIRELQQAGRTIVLSAHQMNLVELLCDRILLINRGAAVLYGDLNEIKARYTPRAVRLRTPAALESFPGVTQILRHNGSLLLELEEQVSSQELLQALLARQVQVDGFEMATIPLQELFIQVVTAQGEHGERADRAAAVRSGPDGRHK